MGCGGEVASCTALSWLSSLLHPLSWWGRGSAQTSEPVSPPGTTSTRMANLQKVEFLDLILRILSPCIHTLIKILRRQLNVQEVHKLSSAFFVSRDTGAWEHPLLPGLQAMVHLPWVPASSTVICKAAASSPQSIPSPPGSWVESKEPSSVGRIFRSKRIHNKPKPSVSSMTEHFNCLKDMQPRCRWQRWQCGPIYVATLTLLCRVNHCRHPHTLP